MAFKAERLRHLDANFENAYYELKRIAARERRKLWESSLSVTDMVGELYGKLHRGADRTPEDLVEFKRYAAKAFRNILIDRARTSKRRQNVTLTAASAESAPITADILDLHRCLEKIEGYDPPAPRLALVLEMSLFSGMTTEEIAQALQLAPATVDRDKKKARIWVADCLGQTNFKR